MDDMYQYAASAVDLNNQNKSNQSVPEEEDIVLKAFNNMGWGKKWSSLVDTVKKQGEAFVEGTKKDLQEFAQVLTEDDDDTPANTIVTDEGQAITRDLPEDNSALHAIRESLANINTVHFTTLRDGLTQTLNQTLPSQITSVRLPENMDLTQLKEGLANGTRSAEHYLQQFGTDVIQALKSTVTVLGPEEEAQVEQEEDIKENSPRIYATRKEALLAKMQTNDDNFLIEPKHEMEQEQKVLDTFNASFKIDQHTEEIAQLLSDYPDLRDTMDRLVPVQVSYPLFWQRYFYHVWKIDQEEQKRQLIVKGVDNTEEDFKWDSDEEEEEKAPTLAPSSSNSTITKKNLEEEQAKKVRVPSSNSDDTDDFSNISEPIESPTPKSSSHTEDEWVKTDKKKSDEEDSDSDWE